jgi:hypothetical protein
MQAWWKAVMADERYGSVRVLPSIDSACQVCGSIYTGDTFTIQIYKKGAAGAAPF